MSNTFRVGPYICTLRFGRDGLQSRWSPTVPKHLSPSELAQYRAGRDALMAEIAQLTGQRLIIVEL